MDYLAFGHFELCQKLLKKAEQLLGDQNDQIEDEKVQSLLSLTLNNLGCFYKK